MSTMIPGAPQEGGMDTVGPDLMGSLESLLGMAQQGEEAEDEHAEEEFVRHWFKRISRAKEAKKKWETNYEVDRSHDYVRGFQRASDDETDAQGDKRMVTNKILAALKAKIPAIFYYNPYIRVRPSRGREDSPGGTVTQRAELLQDTINTIIRMPETRFKQECMVALKEAHWAFGVVEGGYTAEWGDNPFRMDAKPSLVENEDAAEALGELDPENEEEMEIAKLQEVPHAETFYVRHIPARQFFVSTNDRTTIERMDWVGYWEWMYVSDVKRTKAYKNTVDLKASAKLSESEGGKDAELEPIGAADTTQDIPPDMVRVWKIWDQRKKKRLILAEGHNKVLREEEYEFFPLYTLRLEVMPGEWYPIPPIYQQLSEQDEYNDAREWMRLVRKGTRPRYMYDKESFDDEELDKLETDEFGTFVGVQNSNMNAIVAINQPTWSEATIRTLSLSEAGFSEQAASSPTARLTRGSGGAPTATEVTAMGEQGDVRASYEQQEVASWLAEVAHGLLKIAVERATLPQWILMNSDPYSPMLVMDAMSIYQTLNQIRSPMPQNLQMIVGMLEMQTMPNRKEMTPDVIEEAYGEGKWDVTVDIESMSPVSESQHAARIMQALNLIASPGPGELLALSPELLKSMLNMMGIRSAQDHKAIMMALQKKMMMNQMAQMVQQMGGSGGSPPGQKGTAPMPGGDQPNKSAGGAPKSKPPQGPPATGGG